MPRKRRAWTSKRKPKVEETWYTIRSIIDERERNGKLEYLIDWDDNPQTGEVYPDEWIIRDWVTETAITEWEERKKSRASERAEPAGLVSPSTELQNKSPTEPAPEPEPASSAANQPAASLESDESQPPRPANWRQLLRVQSASKSAGKRQAESEDSDDEPLAKKPRRDFALSPSQEPVPSITSSESFPSVSPFDAPEEPFFTNSSPAGLLTVELNRPDFDPSEYQSVHGSQSSLYSSQPISELESQDKRIAFASNTSQKTIPDSQDTSNPSLLAGHTQSTTQSSHGVQQYTIPDSQSQAQDDDSSQRVAQNLGQLESALSSVPEEYIPDSSGVNTDIPSRQPIHQLNLDSSTDHSLPQATNNRSVEIRTTPEPHSQRLLSSDWVDFAEKEAQPSTSESQNPAPTSSEHQDTPELNNQDPLPDSASCPNDSETLRSIRESQTLPELDQPEPAPLSRESGQDAETEERQITGSDSQARQVQSSQTFGRDESSEIQDAQQRSTGSQAQATSEPSQELLQETVPSGPSEVAASERTSSEELAIGGKEIQGSPSRAQNKEAGRQESQDRQGSVRHEISPSYAQGDIEEAQEGAPVLRSCEAIEPERLKPQDSIPKDDQKLASGVRSSRVSEAPFLSQPDFAPFLPGLSSSHQRPHETPDRQTSADFKPPVSTRSLPEYSPGIILSLCEDSESHSITMLGPETGENATGRPSALAGMQAIWDDEPVKTEKKEPFEEHNPPIAEPLPSTSSYHSATIAGPSGQGFFSQLGVDDQPWAGHESPSLATGGVGSSGAVSEMRKLLGDDFSQMADAQPVTVSPADVSLPSEAERLTLPVLPSHDVATSSFSNSGQYISPVQLPNAEKDPSEPETLESHLVTLPFPSNIRERYFNTLMKYADQATAFGDAFTSQNLPDPEPALVAAISNLFALLRNFCDFPESALDMKDVPLDQQVKYYLDASSKLSFLYELFQAITKETKILIVARSADTLRLLCNMAEVLQLEFSCPALGHSVANPSSHLHLTLSLHKDTFDLRHYGVVISYDSVSSDSDLIQNLTTDPAREKQPLVLRLAIAFSLEHIEAEIPPSVALLRKASVLGATANARFMVVNPPRLPKPHEVAAIFSDFINETAESIVWEPEPLPANVLDIYASQSASQMQREISVDSETAGKKRKLDEDADPETKRARVESHINLPPLSDPVLAVLTESGFMTIDASTAPKERQLNMPLDVVEVLVNKALESQRAAVAAEELEPRYRALIENLQRQVQEYEKSQEKTYKRFREAIEDRTKFEAEAQKATTTLNQVNDAAKQTQDKSEKKIAELEAVIARLTQDEAVAANEKALEEAYRKIQTLEKRLETSHSTEAYTRDLYQQVSNSVHATNTELKQVKERNAELEKLTTEHMVQAQQEQSKNSSRAFLLKIAELETSLRETQIELDRTREENRGYKNGRRETRQVSVPCSPRVGSLMSPRPRAAFGGSASRGASPAPVMGAFDGPPVPSQFSTPSGNGRFIRR